MKIFTKITGFILCIVLSCLVVYVDASAYMQMTEEDLNPMELSDEFCQDEWEDAISDGDWYIGDSGEPYTGDFFTDEEETIEDTPGYSTQDLDTPGEDVDLEINIDGIIGLMSKRSDLAGKLNVAWDGTNKFLIQGGCSDGEYVYLSFHVYTRIENITSGDKILYDTAGQRILCAKLLASGQIDPSTAVVSSFANLDHANSLTYNSKTDQVIVANLYSQYVEPDKYGNEYNKKTNEYNRVTLINADYLRGETEIINGKEERVKLEASYRYIPCKVNSIVYDEYEDRYIVGISGEKYSFAVLNSDFLLEKVVDYEKASSEDEKDPWVRNDIWCDNSNIYALVMKKGTDGYKNILMVFNKNAIDRAEESEDIEGKEINLNFNKSCEVENIFKHGDEILIGCFGTDVNGRSNYGYFPLSLNGLNNTEPHIFKIEYEPNYDGSNNVTGSDNSRKSSIVIRHTSTELLPNTFAKSEHRFKGWAAYWVGEGSRPGKWYCNTDSGRSWEDTYNSTEDLYIYSDCKKVSQTVPAGDTVVMVAQWDTVLYFTVKFLSNDENNKSLIKQYTHGQTNYLDSCTFTQDHIDKYDIADSDKSNLTNVFLGWNAHWVEIDKWYYKSADGSSKGWYKEGSEPEGYKKYVYSDGAKVVQTVPKGQNVEMYAVWNDFKTYYFAGGKVIDFDSIKTPTLCPIRQNANSGKTDLKSYLTDSTATPWYVYNVNTDKWCYKNESNTREWYTFGTQPNNYVKYINAVGTVRNTAEVGESLVMCWKEYTSEAYDFVN